MRAFLIVYSILSTIISIGGIAYVIVDIVLSSQHRAYAAAPVPAPADPPPAPIPPPAPTPATETLPPPVEEIDAEAADLMLSDDLVLRVAQHEYGAGHGQRAAVNLGQIDEMFQAGDIVTIDALRRKALVPRRAGRVKILADGVLRKPLTIKAESFSVQAMKMIELTGGTVIILENPNTAD